MNKLSSDMKIQHWPVGTRLRVIRLLPSRTEPVVVTTEGCVVGQRQLPTGSWFAGGKDGRMWLDRMLLERDDGERVWCHVDHTTRIEVVE